MDKTHVEHAIGLVQDQDLNGRQVNGFLLHQIEQATRRCHHDINAAAQAVDLWVHADAAKNGDAAELQVFFVAVDRFFNLRS